MKVELEEIRKFHGKNINIYGKKNILRQKLYLIEY